MTTILITGANSGLGFEAAGQLAERGYAKIILACRSLEKAEDARSRLKTRVGSDPFDTLEIDVSSISSAKKAASTLIERGEKLDQLLLNAGVVPGDKLMMSIDGIEMSFAASLIGHHILTNQLVNAGRINDHGRIVIVSSEGARDDLPAAMGLKLYDFAKSDPVEFGSDLETAMETFARRSNNLPFEGMRQYGTVKLFTTWWAAELAEKLGNKIDVIAVSPGASMGTNAARHVTGFKRFLFTKVMPAIGPIFGMDQAVPVAAKRYVDVLTAPTDNFKTGRAYMSKSGKMVGPMVEQTYPHLYEETRRKIAWKTIEKLSTAG
jgi:NAD(P)-dependent dehydrogenase (short-subunit alcohol dehydrogenase family)